MKTNEGSKEPAIYKEIDQVCAMILTDTKEEDETKIIDKTQEELNWPQENSLSNKDPVAINGVETSTQNSGNEGA